MRRERRKRPGKALYCALHMKACQAPSKVGWREESEGRARQKQREGRDFVKYSIK